MFKLNRVFFAVMAFVFMAGTATAQDGASSSINFSGSFGAGFVIIGAGLGIGKLAAASVESMARQPEVADKISTSMIIAAALIEGVTFFALIVCFLSK